MRTKYSGTVVLTFVYGAFRHLREGLNFSLFLRPFGSGYARLGPHAQRSYALRKAIGRPGAL